MTEARNHSALLTDLYQLTMGFAYWREGIHEQDAVFNLFFRKNPFGGGFSVAAGLADAVSYLADFKFSADDLAYLAVLAGNDGKPIFHPEFLDYLEKMRFCCDVDAILEGRVVFAHEPLLRIRGPMLQCQLVETALLNMMNFPTLIATKAARVCLATQGEPVLEFGLRRAQGADGALSASRAAYLGGCTATSNVLAGKLFGIPVRGTHAHSWVMAFDRELESFRAYARTMPNNCTFLVDTYDTIKGVENALIAARELEEKGFKWNGIRLDSGDLSNLSIRARELMNTAGFTDASIVASNDLDEYVITNLKAQGARINVWGVGTNLVTAYDQPALGGVFKLSATRETVGDWKYKVKLSEQPSKVSTPGIQQVKRYTQDGVLMADMIYDTALAVPGQITSLYELSHAGTMHPVLESWQGEDLLVPVLRGGERTGERPDIHQSRANAQKEIAALPDGIKRLVNPDHYPVGLETNLHMFKHQLIDTLRNRSQE